MPATARGRYSRVSYHPTCIHIVPDAISSTPPFRISQLATSYEQNARQHLDQVQRTLASLHYQHSALRIASSVLDLHVLAIADVYDGVSVAAQREIDRQDSLLNGLDADLQIVARVHVHKEFMSAATRKAMELGERGRTLGDYVSRVKMRQVADSCMRTLGKRFAVVVGAVLLTCLECRRA